MKKKRGDPDRSIHCDNIRWRGMMSPRGMIVLVSAMQHRGVGAQPSTELQNSSYGYLANFNSSMAIVIVFLVCAFFLLGFFSVYLRRCAESRDATATGAPTTARASRRRRGLDPALIETFPILVYSAIKSLKGSLECAVCLSEFEDGDTLRLLPKCGHVFHPDCIEAWLASHVTCPVCRSKLSAESTETATCRQRNDEESNVREGSSESVTDGDRAVVISVDEIQVNRPPRRLPRSHSTGHSVSRLEECTERYTLRELAMKRCSSYDVVLPWAGTGSDRQTGRFFSRGNCSVKSPKGGGDGSETEGEFCGTPLRSVSLPVDCRDVKGENKAAEGSPSPILLV